MNFHNSPKVLNKALELFPNSAPYLSHIDDMREVFTERECAAWMLNNEAAGMSKDTLDAHTYVLGKFNSFDDDGKPGEYWGFHEARVAYTDELYEVREDWCESSGDKP